MTDDTLPPALWEATRQVGRRPPKEPAARPDEVLPGGVWVLPAPAEERLFWVVLQRDAAQGALWLAPADLAPWLGPGDIRAVSARIGPLTLRCRWAAFTREEPVRQGRCVGVLSPHDLAHGVARWQAIRDGRAAPTFSEAEVAEDPEYQDWLDEVLLPAVTALKRAGSFESSGLTESPAPPREAVLLPSRFGAWRRWAAAAAMLPLVCLGAAGWWRVQQLQRDLEVLRAATAAVEAAHAREIAGLAAERKRLEADLQTRLAAAGADRARLEAEYQERFAEVEHRLAALRQAAQVRNPQIASFEPGSVTRSETVVTFAPETSHLLLVFAVDDPTGTPYHLEVYERRTGRQVAAETELRVDELGAIQAGIPAALLPPGLYRLRLVRHGPNQVKEVWEELVAVRAKGSAARPPIPR